MPLPQVEIINSKKAVKNKPKKNGTTIMDLINSAEYKFDDESLEIELQVKLQAVNIEAALLTEYKK